VRGPSNADRAREEFNAAKYAGALLFTSGHYYGQAAELQESLLRQEGLIPHMQSSPSQAIHKMQEDFWLHCLLIVVALLEGVKAILDLPLIIDRPNLLYGPWGVMPATWTGIILAKLNVISHPLLVIAALMFPLSGKLREALIALGAITVVSWLSILPVMLQDEMTLRGFWTGWWAIQWSIAQVFVFPALAGIAIALAVLTSRTMLSAVLIAIPTAYDTYDMAYFVIRAVIRQL
jgi:hypothetical protein